MESNQCSVLPRTVSVSELHWTPARGRVCAYVRVRTHAPADVCVRVCAHTATRRRVRGYAITRDRASVTRAGQARPRRVQGRMPKRTARVTRVRMGMGRTCVRGHSPRLGGHVRPAAWQQMALVDLKWHPGEVSGRNLSVWT